LGSSETKLKAANRPASAATSAQSSTKQSTRQHETLESALVRYAIFALIALLCFMIAAFALSIWSAYAHYQDDYATTGAWTAWFNGPILDRDQQAVTDALPTGASAVYSLTGDLAAVNAHGRSVKGDKNELRYYLAASTQDGPQLFGTWVASNTYIAGRKQATTPVIIDQRTARQLGVGSGDMITLEVKLADEHSNEVQGRFTALITAIARPTSQFKGVALVSPAMQRFVSSAQQVAATDLYVFGGKSTTPQDLANALSHDQIKGARRADMVKASAADRDNRATVLRYSIAGVVILVLGIYALGELRFSVSGWQITDKNGLFSMRRVRLRMGIDLLSCLFIFAVTATVGILLANGVIRTLLAYEPVRSTTIQTAVLFVFVSLVLLVLRAAYAHLIFRKQHGPGELVVGDHE